MNRTYVEYDTDILKFLFAVSSPFSSSCEVS